MSAPNPLSCSRLTKYNTFISKSYLGEDWKVKDAIREVLQNQYDGINMKIGKSNVKIIPKGNDRLNAFEFEFRHKETNELYGEINYNENFKELEVWNIGALETADLLLGCQKYTDSQTNTEIIGRFGEGMKLAALTFLKSNIYYRILTTGEEWIFKIEIDDRFKRKGVSQECLFLYRQDLTGEDIKKYKNKVCVIISNIDKKIWQDTIDNFLWLTQKEMGKVPVEVNGKYLGEILLGKDFCYKNYVKEIYVDKIEGNFGLNLKIDLDRDRNCIPNLNQRNEEAHKLISNVLENLKESNDISNNFNLNYLNNTEFTRATQLLLREFPNRIYNSLASGNGITQYLYTKIGPKAATLLFNEWEQKWKEKKNDFIEGTQPGYGPDIYKFLNEHKLDPSFYPYLGYYTWHLMNCMTKSIRYLSINTKFDNYTKNSVVSEVPNSHKNIVSSIVQKVKIAKNDFSENNLKFKKYTHNDNSFVYAEKGQNNEKIIYFSYSLFQLPVNEFKYFVFGKCLELNDINIKAIAEKYALI